MLSKKIKVKTAKNDGNEAEVDNQAPEVHEEPAEIGEKTIVLHFGYPMHQFLMAGQNPREPLYRKDDLMENGLQDQTVWKYDNATTKGHNDLEKLGDWLFCRNIH